MPSSTSNSENFNAEHQSNAYRIIPDKPFIKMLFIASILLVVGLILWEMLAYKMHHTPGTYQTGFESMWAEERSKLDSPNNIKVVLTGSSRILWGMDIHIIEEHLGSKPLQLALPGTGPALFVKDIVETTDFNGLLIVGVAPFLFNRMDEGYFGKGALDAYNQQSPSGYTGAKLHDFLSDYIAFLDDAFSMPELLERYTQLPYRPGSKKLLNEQWKLGNIYQERLTEMWQPVEQVGSFDNTQITNFWSGGLSRKPPPAKKINEMAQISIEYYKPLIAKIRKRGGDILFLRMPSSGDYLKFDLNSDYYNQMWQPMIEGLDVTAINAMDYPELSSELDTPEWSHLSRKSQDIFSHKIVDFIDQAYQKKRGKSVFELLNLTKAE